jgi:hypothetical protein
MKKQISIEALLRWAFNEELCKGVPVAASAWDAVERFGLLGCRVDTGHHGTSGFGFTDGEPHDDAKAVARAISELPKGMSLPEGFPVRDLAGDYAALLDGDALSLLSRASFNAKALVIRCATFKNRPVWDIGEPELQKMIGSNGAPLVCGIAEPLAAAQDAGFKRARKDARVSAWTAPGNGVDLVAMKVDSSRRGYDLEKAPRCLLSWEGPAPFEYAEVRAEYVVWQGALRLLRDALRKQGGLLDYDLIEEIPPLSPWIDEERPAPIVRQSQRPATDIPLTVSPLREPSLPPKRYTLPKNGESRRKLAAADIG